MSAASHLRAVLQRETSGRVSLNSFIGQYLLVLDFPPDVQDALCDGRVNLQEAAQLARLTPERLGCELAEALRTRRELLRAHTTVQGSQTRLCARVREMLGDAAHERPSSEGMAEVVAKVDELLEVDPGDTRHLFFEEMKRIFFAMREIQPEDLDQEVMDDFLQGIDQVSNVLYRIEKRRQKREKPDTSASILNI